MSGRAKRCCIEKCDERDRRKQVLDGQVRNDMFLLPNALAIVQRRPRRHGGHVLRVREVLMEGVEGGTHQRRSRRCTNASKRFILWGLGKRRVGFCQKKKHVKDPWIAPLRSNFGR